MERRSMKVGTITYADDLEQVIHRAEQAGVAAQVITTGALAELPSVLQLTELRPSFFCTAGCHPTHSNEMENYHGGPQAYVSQLQQMIQAHNRIVAVGECGLGTWFLLIQTMTACTLPPRMRRGAALNFNFRWRLRFACLCSCTCAPLTEILWTSCGHTCILYGLPTILSMPIALEAWELCTALRVQRRS